MDGFKRLVAMRILISIAITIALLLGRGSSSNINSIKCPLRCKCDRSGENASKEWSVECDEKTKWIKMPMLPLNTTYLSINKSYIPTLQNGKKRNRGGETLYTLILNEDEISTVVSGFFNGMGFLKKLSLSKNNLKSLQNGTFESLTNLEELHLDHNSLTALPENICLLEKLRILDLNWNNLTRVKFGECFTELRHVYSLDLSGNPIDRIESGDLDGLKNSQLSILLLRQMKLTKITSEVFKNLGKLRFLCLKNNRIKRLPSDLFKYSPGITTLILQGNKLGGIPSKTIQILANLEVLNLARTNTRSNVLGKEFRKFKNVTELDLSYNPIHNLINRSFANLNSLEMLTRLSLIGCKLKYIEAGTFLALRHLRVLELSGNILLAASQLKTAFYGLQYTVNLTELYLDKTTLTDLDNTTFEHLSKTSVSYIQLGAARLQSVPTGAFCQLPNLKWLVNAGSSLNELKNNSFCLNNSITELNFRKNNLIYMPRASAINPVKLKTLILNSNSIKKLYKGNLKGYDLMEELNLQNNRLTVLDDYTFVGAEHLKKLLITSNQIFTINKFAFEGLGNLQELYIDRNNIIEIDAEAFVNTPKLTYLNLAKNINFGSLKVGNNLTALLKPLRKLTTVQLDSLTLPNLPPDVFFNLTELQAIKLSNNLLSKLDDNTFKDQSKLKILSLRKNKLPSINKTLLDPLANHLTKLDVSENIFQCECNIQWFTDWIRTAKVYMPHLDTVICDDPSFRRGTQLQNLYLDKECMHYIIYYIFWAILLFNMIVITTCTMIYRHRWYIKYWLHLVRARKAMEREMGEERYVFDAFVSYAHQDMKWVVGELLPKLEYEAGIKLCLHQRNWLGGRSIARNIIDSIERSRKTVLILSEYYARSKWGELEMSLAQHKLLTSRREFTVPILLEDIKKQYVTEQMVCLFASQTYIKYPKNKNEKEKRRFWRQLIQTLRPTTENPQYDEDPNVFLTDINAVRPSL